MKFRTERYHELKLIALANQGRKEPFQTHAEITAQVMAEWYAAHPKKAFDVSDGWNAYVAKRVADFKTAEKPMKLSEVTRIAKEEWAKLKEQEVA
jgi:hypothetical protein